MTGRLLLELVMFHSWGDTLRRSRKNLKTLIFFFSKTFEHQFEIMSYSCQKCKKNGGDTKFVAEIKFPEDHLKFEKSGFITEYMATVSVFPKTVQVNP